MRLKVHFLVFDRQLSKVHYCRAVDPQKLNRSMQLCTFHLIMQFRVPLFGSQYVS